MFIGGRCEKMKYCISVNFMDKFALFFIFRGNLVDNVLMIIYCCHDRKCLNFLEHLWNLIAPIYVKKKKKKIWWAAGIFGRYEYYTNQWHNLIQKKKFITNLNCWHNFKKKKPPHCSTMNFWTLNTSFAKFLNTKYFVFPNSFLCQN